MGGGGGLRAAVCAAALAVSCGAPGLREEDAIRSSEAGRPVLEAAGLRAAFGAGTASVVLGEHALTLRAAAVVRDGIRCELAADAPARLAETEVRRETAPGVVEWWRTTAAGLEHGLELASRPDGDGELAVEIEVGGPRPRAVDDDTVALFEGETHVATYAHLTVLDADGTAVPARMDVVGSVLVLRIEDASARYPLSIDPLLFGVEEATLTAAMPAANDWFGNAVALDAAADRALVGAYFDDTGFGTDAGSATVLSRTGTSWSVEATLLPSTSAMGDEFGRAVALSADGTIALVGAPRFATMAGPGRAFVFTRSGTTWAEEAVIAFPEVCGGFGTCLFGRAVALAADGSRAVVGAPYAALNEPGRVYVFLRGAGTWSLEATLARPGAQPRDHFGASLSLSSDASTVIVGAPDADTAAADGGAADVFTRSGPSWTHEATLSAPDLAATDRFAWSVAIAASGDVAVLGVLGDDVGTATDAGSARVFRRTGTNWTAEATLSPADAAAGDELGFSVALTADGSLAAITAWRDDPPSGSDTGSVRLFSFGTAWAEAGTLTHGGALNGDRMGSAVALAADGSRAIAGLPEDDYGGLGNPGTARVFRVGPTRVDGAACGVGAECMSGFCVDGVCCDGACGAGVADCQACSAALTGGTDGTCAPLSAALAPGITCRAAAGVCDAPETCSESSTACPANALRPMGTLCRATSGACDGPEVCTGTSTTCPADVGSPAAAGTICRAPSGPCDSPEACDGTSVGCPPNAYVAAGTECRPVAGTCDVAERCSGTGPGCPGDAVLAGTVTCRPASGPCDALELCTGAGPTCPTDAFFGLSVVCRPATGPCDVEDRCDATGPACADTLQASGTSCRPTVGPCDLPEDCTGVSAACPPNGVLGTGTVCRASLGACDLAEACDGVSGGCPADVRQPAGTACGGASSGPCALPSTCDGTDALCAGTSPRPAGTVCLPAAAGNPCDVDDVCDGVTVACPAAYAAPSTACGPAATEPCDAPDHCTGTSADCEPAYLAGIECRPSAGTCDPAEICVGDSTGCPTDLVAPSGASCRGSTDPACDPAEVCDGVAASCPTDVTACGADAGDVDAGATDAGTVVTIDGSAGPVDGGTGAIDARTSDAGVGTGAPGCGCRAVRVTSVRMGLSLLVVGTVARSRKRTARAQAPA